MRNPPMPMRTPGRIQFNWHPAGPSWLRMQPSPELVLQARRFTHRLLAGCDSGFIDDAELVTSELVTNSMNFALLQGDPPKHVAPGIWLGVQPLKRYAHIRVRDPYPVSPVKRVAADTDTSGRGLLIVEMLTAAHWVDGRKFDKTMHAVLAKPDVVLTEAELDGLRR